MVLVVQLLLITVNGILPPGNPVSMTQPFGELGYGQGAGAGPKFAPVMVKPTCGGPDGSDNVLIVGSGWMKFAVTLSGPFIVRYCGVVVPPRLPLKPEKTYPLAAEALTWTTTPLLYHPLAGLIVPPWAGDTAVVR